MIRITIDTAGAAFDGDYRGIEAARILRVIADKIDDYGDAWNTDKAAQDINGNTCATMEVMK